MDLKLDYKAICNTCKKDKRQVELCRMRDKNDIKMLVDIEFSVCGVCGKGYCSLRADPIERECEHCEHEIYNNVNEDGTLKKQVEWVEPLNNQYGQDNKHPFSPKHTEIGIFTIEEPVKHKKRKS